jgi:iturin family lipopeptide synthetase A
MNIGKAIRELSGDKRAKLIQKIRTDGERYGIYPLTPDQFLLWCGYRGGGNAVHFSNPGIVVYLKNITRDRVREAIDRLCELQDALRYSFVEFEDEVWQYLNPDIEETVFESTMPQDIEDRKLWIEKKCLDLSWHPFDLENGHPAIYEMIRLAPREYALLICTHHIISDGMSVGILYRNLREILNGTARRSAVQFGNYACMKRTDRERRKDRENIAYWTDQIRDVDKFPAYPTDFERMSDRPGNAEDVIFSIDGTDYAALKNIARKTKANLFTVLSALFSLVFAAWSGRKKFIMGTTLFNRPGEQYERIAGDFASMIPLVFTVEDDSVTLDRYIRRCMERFLEGMAHGDVTLTGIQEAFPHERKERVNPLFQITFIFHSEKILAGGSARSGNVETSVDNFPNEKRQINFTLDLTIEVIDHQISCEFRAHFSRRIFQRSTIENLMRVYREFLKKADREGETRLCRL